jgi:o-succinylbenzoate synthase
LSHDKAFFEFEVLNHKMRLQKLTLREIHLRLISPFETSFGRTELRRILLAEAEIDGISGWGESTAGENPFYSYETVETDWIILRDYLWPMLKGREVASASEVWDILSAVRGHNMAKAAIETAFWDAEAKQKNVSVSRLLGGTLQEIPCGVSIGIQPTIAELISKVEKELAAGYLRIKIKIKPGNDIEPVRALRERFPRIRLMVDANSAYSLQDAPHLKELDAYYLIMIEQPLGWDDIFSHVELQRRLDTPICLDECIHEVEHARAAIETGACRIINIKLGRVGGHTAARRIHDLCQSKSVPVWCGGMLESGIGRAHNIAMSSLANFNLPGDVSASRRYWEQDIIEPEVEVSRKGTIRVSDDPGIGYVPRLDRIEELTRRIEILK